MLTAIDRRQREGPVDDIVLCAVLLLEPMREACAGTTDRVGITFEFLEPVVDRLNVPRRIADAVRRIVAMMPRLLQGKSGKFRRTPLYNAAREVLEVYEAALSGNVEAVSFEPAEPSLPASAEPGRRGQLELTAPLTDPGVGEGSCQFELTSTLSSLRPMNR